MKRPLSLLVSMVILALIAAPTRIARAADGSTAIYRDEFNVTRIFAPTLSGTQLLPSDTPRAEDRLEELLKNYRRAEKGPWPKRLAASSLTRTSVNFALHAPRRG